MATSQATIDYLLDQLSGVPSVTARKMFGEYAVYCSGKVVGLVSNDTLFVKITDEGKRFAGSSYEEGEAYPGSKPWMRIDEDRIEDRDWLGELIEITAMHAPRPKPKKKKAAKKR